MISKPIILVASGTALVPILLGCYVYISDDIDKNSSLVRQTMVNIRRIKSIKLMTGGNCQLTSRIAGEMLQRKGIADINFNVQCKHGQFLVRVLAHRQGMNWRTREMHLSGDGENKESLLYRF